MELHTVYFARDLTRHPKGRGRVGQLSSAQSLDWLGCQGGGGDKTDDSADTLLQSFLLLRPVWAVLVWAGMSALWCGPSSFSSANHGIAHPPRCPEGCFWRGFHSVCDMPEPCEFLSLWQWPGEVPVDQPVVVLLPIYVKKNLFLIWNWVDCQRSEKRSQNTQEINRTLFN